MISLADTGSRRMVFALCPLLISMMFVSGCRMTVLPPTSEDSARDRNAVLREENDALKRENEGLKIRVSEAEAGLNPQEVMISEATPRLVSMLIQDSSLVEVPDGETAPSQLTLRMAPSDDRGRFLQVVGGLSVTVVAVPKSGEPVLLAQRDFSPVEVREGWRGGLMGSGYVFEVPFTTRLEAGLPDSVDVVTLFEGPGVDPPVLRDEHPVRVRRSKD